MSDEKIVDAIVRVECDNHAGRRRLVRTFGRGDGEWGESLEVDEPDAGRAGHYLYGHVDAEVGDHVDGNDPRVWEGLRPGDPMLRIRYMLRCPSHRAGAVAITDRQLKPILDTLAEHGVECITLRDIGARLRNS